MSYHLDANNAPDNNGIINCACLAEIMLNSLINASVSDVLVKPLSLFSSSLTRTCMRSCVWPTCTCCRVWSVCVAELWPRCSMRRTCFTCGRRQNCSGSRVWRTSAQNTWPRSSSGYGTYSSCVFVHGYAAFVPIKIHIIYIHNECPWCYCGPLIHFNIIVKNNYINILGYIFYI